LGFRENERKEIFPSNKKKKKGRIENLREKIKEFCG
jgi:hypothetical protein